MNRSNLPSIGFVYIIVIFVLFLIFIFWTITPMSMEYIKKYLSFGEMYTSNGEYLKASDYFKRASEIERNKVRDIGKNGLLEIL